MSKITQLTEDTSPTGDDLIETVQDPAGTPLSRKVKIQNLLKRLFLGDATMLTVTTIADGEFLKRSGTNITSGVPAGTGLGGSTGANDNRALRADGTGGATAQASNLTIPDDAAATEVGYLNIPQNSQSANYTAILGDRGWHLFHPAGDNNPRTFTIPANASIAFAVGTAITFVNKINTLTIAINSDTLTWAQDGSTGSRTLAANGMATALKITATEWLIDGPGLS